MCVRFMVERKQFDQLGAAQTFDFLNVYFKGGFEMPSLF